MKTQELTCESCGGTTKVTDVPEGVDVATVAELVHLGGTTTHAVVKRSNGSTVAHVGVSVKP